MRAGNLRHRIELQSVTETRNSFGELSVSYSTYDTVWASIKTLKAEEKEYSSQVEATAEHEIIIRHNSSVSETDRIIFGSRTFEVESVENWQERNIFMKLKCNEVK